MNKKWQMLSKNRVYDGFYKVDSCEIEHSLFQGGTTNPMKRELLYRGNVAAVLPYDKRDDSVVLIEQFRIGATNQQDPWLVEVIAGMVETGESPEDMVYREAEEEAGLTLDNLSLMTTYLASPGMTTEEVFIYSSLADLKDAGGYFGLETENEDIRVLKMKADEAIELFDKGVIRNAISVIAMLWLKLNIDKLRQG